MNTVYVSRALIPSNSANSIHVMKISEAFAELSDNFTLIVPANEKPDFEDNVFDFYGIKKGFPIERVKEKSKLGGLYRYYFAWNAMKIITRYKCDKVITRDPILACLCVLRHKDTVLDLHGELAHLAGRAYHLLKWNYFKNNKHMRFVMITKSLVQYYEKNYQFNTSKCTVLPDGCTPENFEPYCENPLFISSKVKLAYAGSFGVGRGYEVIQELAAKDKENEYHIYGGKKEDALTITGKEPSDNIFFHGFIANRDIPRALCNHDILLLPYQNKLIAKGEDTGKVMSPLKLFEYMASGRVIAASDLEVLREIIDESNCYFAVPDDPENWAETIRKIIADKEEAKKRALKAKQDVNQYTWKIRAQKMLEG